MPKRILVVDDDLEVRVIVRIALEFMAGWNVRTARSGAQALKIASEACPDAILLDVMMPHRTGDQRWFD